MFHDPALLVYQAFPDITSGKTCLNGDGHARLLEVTRESLQAGTRYTARLYYRVRRA